jgi:hypothetical protein
MNDLKLTGEEAAGTAWQQEGSFSFIKLIVGFMVVSEMFNEQVNNGFRSESPLKCSF